jgi:hypothetical protein
VMVSPSRVVTKEINKLEGSGSNSLNLVILH